MSARWRAAALVVVLAIVASGCSLIGGGGSYTLSADFPRTISLYESSKVKVLGLPAGTVSRIEVVGDHVRVTMRIDDDIPLPAEVRATVMPQSLIGERYVQLYPAWQEGLAKAEDGDHIPPERASVPVEPDEALAALKKFLDTLDPDGTGRLVHNLADILDGRGEQLGSALEELSQLVSTFAAKDDVLASLVDNFDEFTATLVTREEQLGEIMAAFADATNVLASERAAIEALVRGLANSSDDALDLVVEHGSDLRDDLDILGRVLRSADANLDHIGDLLDSGPLLVNGLDAAVDPEYHRTDLRNVYEPTVGQALINLGVPIGDTVCLPVDVDCETLLGLGGPAVVRPERTAPAAKPGGPNAANPKPPAGAVAHPDGPAILPHGPFDGFLDLLTTSVAPTVPDAGADGPGGASGFLRSLVGSVLGVVW